MRLAVVTLVTMKDAFKDFGWIVDCGSSAVRIGDLDLSNIANRVGFKIVP